MRRMWTVATVAAFDAVTLAAPDRLAPDATRMRASGSTRRGREKTDPLEVNVMRWMERDGTRLMAEVKRWFKISVVAAFIMAAAPSAWARVYVKIQAPDIRIETHEERRGYIWQSGRWQWRNQRHEWTNGRYVREHKGRHWTDGRWEHNDRGHYWVDGRWER